MIQLNKMPNHNTLKLNEIAGNREEKQPIPPVVFDFKNITVDLFSTTAKKYADMCAKASAKTNKSTQLRRFYNELVLWAERSDTSEKYVENLPFIYMIKSKVAYAVGRGTVDENFQAMMTGVINGIKAEDIKTLKHAKLFLEAFMGYYKELTKE